MTTRSEERKQRSMERAIQNRRKRQWQIRAFALTVVLFVGVPLLWYSALEYGLVKPIQNPGLDKYLNLAHIAILILGLYLYGQLFMKPRSDSKKKQTQGGQQAPLSS